MERLADEVLRYLKGLLPDRSRVLIISFTGSRAFGWGSDQYDIDLRTVVYSPGYWDTFHSGEIWDLNGEELSHLFNSILYRYWTNYEDLSRPIYVDTVFDFDTYMSLCTARNVRVHYYTIELQLNMAKTSKTVRDCLHAYRLLLCPLYFLDSGKVEIYVPKVAEQYNVEYIWPLIEAYSKMKYDYKPPLEDVFRELDHLKGLLDERLRDRTDDLDMEKFTSWKQNLLIKLGSIYEQCS